MFARWGRPVYRWRWAALVFSTLLLGISVAGLSMGGALAAVSCNNAGT